MSLTLASCVVCHHTSATLALLGWCPRCRIRQTTTTGTEPTE